MLHFVSQTAHESQGFKSRTENYTRRVSSVASIEKVYPRFFTLNLKQGAKYEAKNYVNQPEKLANFVNSDEERLGLDKEIIKRNEGITDPTKRIKTLGGLGNLNEGDGWRYIGRGIIQLTGRENYRKCSTYLRQNMGINVDFEANPKLVVENIEHSVLAALYFFHVDVRPKLARINKTIDNATIEEVSEAINPAGRGEDSRIAQYNKVKNANIFK